MSNYSVLIVDDEIINITILERFIKKYCPAIKVIGHVMAISDAVSVISRQKPDILFLDISLNEGDAFDILDQLTGTEAQVIFVTSHDEFAVKAFKYNAVDYILKPIVAKDVVVSINKAIKNIETQQFSDFRRLALSMAAPEVVDGSHYLAVPSIDKIDILNTAEIVYLVAGGGYTIFHTKTGGIYTSTKNMLYFEQVLDNKLFYRIHHSYMINIEHLEKVIKKNGNYCEMTTGVLLPIARRKMEGFSRFIKVKP